MIQLIRVMIHIGYVFVLFHSPTPTPYPSIPPTQNLGSPEVADIQRLLDTTGDCEMPCLMGLIPGESTIDDVEYFINQNLNLEFFDSTETDNQRTVIYDWINNKREYEIVINFTFEDDLLVLIDLYSYEPQGWMASDIFEHPYILTQQKVLPAVYIAINPVINVVEFRILVISYDRRVSIEYIFELDSSQIFMFDSINMCQLLGLNSRINIHLTIDESHRPTIRIPDTLDSSDFYMPQEFFTNMSTEAFVQEIVENPDCHIEVLPFMKLFEKGYTRIFER